MKLELTIEEVNYILGILATKPYNEVAQLISKIADQSTSKKEDPKE